MAEQQKAPRALNRRPKWHPRLLPEANPGDRPQYLHPSHPWPVSADRAGGPREQRPPWTCSVCNYEWSHDSNDQRGRYRSQEPRDPFDLCGTCLLAPWSAWRTKKHLFIQGEPIVFSNVVYMGTLKSSDLAGGAGRWPAADDHQRWVQVLDKAHADGDLPRRSRDRRALHLSHSHIKIGDDHTLDDFQTRQQVESEQSYYYEYPLDAISSMSYIDDNPTHYLLLTVGAGAATECHVLTVSAGELANAVCEAVQSAFQFVHVEAILHDMDDNILAGLEKRPTAVQSLAEKSGRRQASTHSPTQQQQQQQRRSASMVQRAGSFLGKSGGGDGIGGGAVVGGARVGSGTGTPAPSSELEAFLQMLQKALSTDEHKVFSGLVRAYRTGQILFEQLSAELVTLFTRARLFLLAGCKCFISDADLPKFKQFLAQSTTN